MWYFKLHGQFITITKKKELTVRLVTFRLVLLCWLVRCCSRLRKNTTPFHLHYIQRLSTCQAESIVWYRIFLLLASVFYKNFQIFEGDWKMWLRYAVKRRCRTRSAQHDSCNLHAGLWHAAQRDSQTDEQRTVQVKRLFMQKEKHESKISCFFVWARQDLNPRPSGYENVANFEIPFFLWNFVTIW